MPSGASSSSRLPNLLAWLASILFSNQFSHRLNNKLNMNKATKSEENLPKKKGRPPKRQPSPKSKLQLQALDI
jgi:hypothetical protein